MKYFYRGARKGDGEDPPETEIFFVENGYVPLIFRQRF